MNKPLPNYTDASGRTLVPIGEASKVLGISQDTLRRWDEKGKIVSKRPDGKNRYFALEDLQNFKATKRFSIGEASEFLGISPTTLRRLDESGVVTAKREGDDRVYELNDLEEFMGSAYFQTKGNLEKFEFKPNPQEIHIESKDNPVNELKSEIRHEDGRIDRLFSFRRHAITASLIALLLLFVLVGGSVFSFITMPKQTSGLINKVISRLAPQPKKIDLSNINAKYVQGKAPGTNTGNIAYFSEDGKIAGFEPVNQISFGDVDLESSQVSGILGLTHGGTGADLSGGSGGGLVYMASGKLATSPALSGVMVGNGSFAPTAATGTENFVLRWGPGGKTLYSTSTIYDNGNVGIGNIDPTQKLDVLGSIYAREGQVRLGNFSSAPTSIGAGSLYYDTSSQFVYYYNGTSWQVVGSGSGGGSGFWNQSSGTLFPFNSTVDALIGGQSTASSKFGFINVNSGTPEIRINNASVLNPTTLGSGVVNSSLTTLGTISSGVWNGTAITDSFVSDTLTSSIFKGSGSTTDAVDLATGEVSGTLAATNGGTGQNSYTQGDILYASNSTTLSPLGIGSGGSCLTSTGAIPAWGSCSVGGGGGMSWWNMTLGALSPLNSTLDVLVGGAASASAKFGLINVNSGTPSIQINGTTVLNPTTLGSGVTGSSLTSVGTISSGVWNGTALTDAFVSDTLTSSIFIGSGSTTNAVDLATAEVSGTLADSNISDNITISSLGSVDWTALTNYPTACGAGQAITALGDSTTCSTFVTSDGDSVIGNEVTNVTDSTLTRSGSGTSGSPYTLGINLANANTWTALQSLNGGILSQGAVTGKALVRLDETGDQNILVASASGVTKLTLDRSGNLKVLGHAGFGANGTQEARSVLIVDETLNPITDEHYHGVRSRVMSNIAFSGTDVTLYAGSFRATGSLSSGTQQSIVGTENSVYNTSGGTITTAIGSYPYILQSGAGTITNAYGVRVPSASNSGGGTITSNYGLAIDTQTAGTSDYGIRVDAADTQTLWVSGNANNTTAAAGIAFGSSRDTNLYRSAADTLKTDDSFITGAGLTAASTVTFSTFTTNGGLLYTNGSGVLAQLTSQGSSGDCLLSNGASSAPSFSGCPGGSGSNFWRLGSGAISPINDSLDFLVGSSATTSAKFAIIGVNNTRGTQTASVSGSLSLDSSTAALQSTLNQTLTIGGSSTGDIALLPRNGAGFVGIGTSTPLTRLEVGSNGASNETLTVRSQGTAGIEILGDTDNDGGEVGTAYLMLSQDGTVNQAMFGISQANGVDAKGATYTNALANGVMFGAYGNAVLQFGTASILRAAFRLDGSYGLGTNSPASQFHVTRPLVWGALGKSLAVFDQIENQDILTASKSGATKFVIDQNGNLGFAGSLASSSNYITTTNFTVTTGGAITGVGVNSGSGLIQGSGGLTISAGTTSITGTTNINTTGSSTTTIGASSGTDLALADANWSVTGVGASTFASLVNTGTSDLRGAVSNSTGNLSLNDAVDVANLLTAGGGLTVADGQTLTANGIVTLGDGGDNFSVDSNALDISTGGVISGATGLTSSGNITFSVFTTNGGILYTNGSGLLTQLTSQGSSGNCLLSAGAGAAPSFSSCPGGSAANFWRIASGAISPYNDTLDLLIGSQATTSAKFAITNVNAARGNQVATLSGDLVLDKAASIQTTNQQTLTLGGSNTGNIVIDSGSSLISLLDNTAITGNLDISGTLFAGTADAFQVSAGGAVTAVGVNSGSGLIQGTGGQTLTGTTNINTTGSSTTTIGASSGTDLALADANWSVTGAGAATFASGTFNGNVDMTNNLVLNIGNAGTDFTSGGGLTLAGTLTANGIVTLGDGGDNFSVDSNALDISSGGAITGATGLTLASGAINLGGTNGTSAQCLLGGATASWGSCGTGGSGSSPFKELSGAIVPLNSTEDFLIGSQATTSAKFAILGVNNARGTQVASISGSISLDSTTAALQSTLNQTLTLGGDKTGDIALLPRNGAGFVGIGTSTPLNRLDIGANGASNELVTVRSQGTAGIEILGDTDNDGSEIGSPYLFLSQDGTINQGIFGSTQTNDLDSKGNTYTGALGNGFLVGTYGNSTLQFGTQNGAGVGNPLVRMTLRLNGTLGLGTNTPASQFHLTRPLSWGATGKALAIFDQIENQDIFTASASGVTKFTIDQNGNVTAAGGLLAAGVNADSGLLQGTGGLTLSGTTLINNTGTASTTIGNSAGGTITIGASSGSDLALNDAQWSITGAGAATFASLNAGSGSISGGAGSFTTLTSTGATTLGTGSSLTNTFGSGASSINTIGSSTTPGALTLHGATTLDNTFTVSGNNLATFGGAASVSGTLTLGGSSGVIRPADGPLSLQYKSGANAWTTALTLDTVGNIGIGTTAPLAALDLRGNLGTVPVASISGQTSFAALVVDNKGLGDLLTASTSGATILQLERTGNLSLFDTSGNSLLQLRTTGTNFGASVNAGAFISRNSYLGQEFNIHKANSLTADTTGATNFGTFGAAAGDDGSWGVYEGGGTPDCTFATQADSINGIMRMTANVADSGCLMMVDEGAGNIRGMFKAANLPVLLMKVKPSAGSGTTQTMVGIGDATDGAVASPSNFIGFSSNLGSSWIGTTRSGGSATNVTCTGATISTTQYALLMVEVRSTTDVHFFYDKDASDGINFTECSTGSQTNVPSGSYAPEIIFQERTGGVASRFLDVDFFRAWQDDAAPSSAEVAVAPQDASSSAEVDPKKMAEVASDSPSQQTYITDSGNVSLLENDLASFAVKKDGKNVNDIGAFAESVIGKLGAGIIKTTSLDVGGEIKIAGQNIKDYIDQRISDKQAPLLLDQLAIKDQVTGLENQIESLRGEMASSTKSATIAVLADSIDKKQSEIDKLEATASASPTPAASQNLDKLRVTGSGLFEGLLTVLDNLTAESLIVNSTSTFFGDAVFKGHIAFSKDSAGEVTIKDGKNVVSVNFDKDYNNPPIVNITLSIDDQNLEDKILKGGYTYAVVARSEKGFSIKLNKAASDDLKFSWTAVEQGN